MKIILTNFITKEFWFRNPCKSTAEPAKKKNDPKNGGLNRRQITSAGDTVIE